MLKLFLIIWVSNVVCSIIAFKAGYRKGEEDDRIFCQWLAQKRMFEANKTNDKED